LVSTTALCSVSSTRATMVTVAVPLRIGAPLALAWKSSAPSAQLTPVSQKPWLGVALTSVRPLGSTS
jgi:hypothetical protein